MAMSSGVHDFTTGAIHTHLAAVVESLETDAFALARGMVEQHHVRQMNGGFALDDAAGLDGLRIRLGVALDQIDVLHEHAIGRDAQHLALLALVFAGDHDDVVTFANSVHGVNSKMDFFTALPER